MIDIVQKMHDASLGHPLNMVYKNHLLWLIEHAERLHSPSLSRHSAIADKIQSCLILQKQTELIWTGKFHAFTPRKHITTNALILGIHWYPAEKL